MKSITRSGSLWMLLGASLVIAQTLSAQCENKTGFAKKACEVESGNVSGLGSNALGLDGSKGEALSTTFDDTIHADTLPPSIEPKAFKPLAKLDRTDDGSFLLKVGIFEAHVESFSFDAERGWNRIGGFYPAPLKGRRANVIAAVLKQSELHPDVPQGDIQQLLYAIVQGADLEKMSPPVQQTAARILPKDTLAQLQGATAAKTMEKRLLGILNDRLKNNPKTAQAMGEASNKTKTLDQKYGVSDTIGDLNGGNAAPESFASTGPVLRGTWVQMPGGFYLRYLPEGMARVRLQVIVPDAAMAQTDPKSPLTFDPTQYLAVYAGAPPERLGITLRQVR